LERIRFQIGVLSQSLFQLKTSEIEAELKRAQEEARARTS
jgi:hypothetical protein